MQARSGRWNARPKHCIGNIKAEAGIVGEMALLNSDVRSATATAQTDCQLALIDQSSFKLLLKHVPDFALHVVTVLATRLQGAYQLEER